jgi:SOS-response transcriptional repressor LexA
MNVSPEWLQFGVGEDSNITHAPPIRKMIPVISWVQAGAFCESNVLELHEVEEWLPCPSHASDKAFGLRVKGDSMTSPHSGERSYPEGIVIYVDPEVDVTSGRRVIAKSNSSDEATFKTYVEDDGLKFLKPINPQFPMKEITDDVHICGVIIGSYWPE